LAFVRVRSKPSAEAFREFEKQFAGSPLVDELRPLMEELFFRQARSQGTAQGYRAFLASFPSGSEAARAQGNAIYLEAQGFGGDPERLAAFAREHPKSDYSAEAQRSVGAVAARARSGFENVALVLDVPSSVPGNERLARLFAERAAEIYRRSGVPLLMAQGPTDPRLSQVGARLTISHRERAVSTQLENGRVEQPGILGETTVTLAVRGEREPVWSEIFTFRAPEPERAVGESVLLHPRAWTTFWSREFFVPVAGWNNQVAAHAVRSLEKPAVAVETLGSRALVVYGDGDFQVLDVSDPTQNVLLGEYRRPRDLAHFEGAAPLGANVGVFGPDGIEIVSLDGVPQRVKQYPRSEVGSIIGVEPAAGGMVAAGKRGLLWIGDDGQIQTLFPREVFGLARQGETILFTDGMSLYLSSVPVLRTGRVQGELRLGRGFRPARVRLVGQTAVVMGDPGLVRVDVSQVSQPRVLSRMGFEEVGPVQDATVVAGRIFLVGARGLQVSDRTGDRVVESVDVAPRHRLAAVGRHVVLIGEKSLQVVDATAFAFGAGAASARP
jgi:hypothetical protein